jgi:hypothetical protein
MNAYSEEMPFSCHHVAIEHGGTTFDVYVIQPDEKSGNERDAFVFSDRPPFAHHSYYEPLIKEARDSM